MKKYIKFSELSDDLLREIITDIFQPKKITCFKKNKREDSVSCKIYTEWGDESDEDGVYTMADELILRNPFLYGNRAIQIDFSLNPDDFKLLKQFCYAHDVSMGDKDLLNDNPYIPDTVSSRIKEMQPEEMAVCIAKLCGKIAGKNGDSGDVLNWKNWLTELIRKPEVSITRHPYYDLRTEDEP